MYDGCSVCLVYVMYEMLPHSRNRLEHFSFRAVGSFGSCDALYTFVVYILVDARELYFATITPLNEQRTATMTTMSTMVVLVVHSDHFAVRVSLFLCFFPSFAFFHFFLSAVPHLSFIILCR